VAGDQDQGPPELGRLGPAVRERLRLLHGLSPGMAARPPTMATALLFAATDPAELETAIAAHQAQIDQLRGPLPAALAHAYRLLAPIWQASGFRALGPDATVAELLAYAPAELAAQVRELLAAAGVDPDALRWPPVVGPGPWPGA
jgi:hypothetical protein